MRGSHAGARSFERSSTPEPFGGFWAPGVAHAVCLSPVARPLPAYRTGESPEEERGSRLRTREGADMVTDWRAPWRGSSKPRAALRAALRRRPPGAQLKIERVPCTGVREGNALLISGRWSQRFSCARRPRSLGVREKRKVPPKCQLTSPIFACSLEFCP